MPTSNDSSRDAFRLSQLIYDTRYRSWSLQIIALCVFIAVSAWLIGNAAHNLASAGKEMDFGFLLETAGYEINQSLIDYEPKDTHLRAAVVGLINTLLVALLGCVSATIIGTLVGVLRLSKNWLIARLMTLYVEVFRNVPLLLWVVMAMAIMTELLPPPSAFRGEHPDATMSLFGSTAVTNRGIYLPEPQFSDGVGAVSFFGDALTLNGNVLVLLFVVAAGLFVSSWIGNWADKVQRTTGDRPRTDYLRISVVLAPVLILLYLFGLHFSYPELKGFNFGDGLRLRNSLIALWAALSFYTAAFIAEIVRGGILAITKGQTEAAEALGLPPGKVMRLVILPQALRVIVPPSISQYLSLTKNSSLAIAVGYMDITGTLGGITLNQTGRELESVLLLMLVYLCISLIISSVMNWYNARFKLVER